MPRPRKDLDPAAWSEVFADAQLDRSRSIGPQVYDFVRLKIILSELPSGTQINEHWLANTLGVSRTPIREAYQKLVHDSLIISQPQVGSIVAPIDDKRVLEGMIIRRALESEVIQILCGRTEDPPGADLNVLDPILAVQKVAAERNDYVEFFKLDEAFHAKLSDLAGIPAAWRLAQSVKAHTDRARIQLMSSLPNRLQQAFEEHGQLITAIRARDAGQAQEIISRHINSVFDALDAFPHKI